MHDAGAALRAFVKLLMVLLNLWYVCNFEDAVWLWFLIGTVQAATTKRWSCKNREARQPNRSLNRWRSERPALRKTAIYNNSQTGGNASVAATGSLWVHSYTPSLRWIIQLVGTPRSPLSPNGVVGRELHPTAWRAQVFQELAQVYPTLMSKEIEKLLRTVIDEKKKSRFERCRKD